MLCAVCCMLYVCVCMRLWSCVRVSTCVCVAWQYCECVCVVWLYLRVHYFFHVNTLTHHACIACMPHDTHIMQIHNTHITQITTTWWLWMCAKAKSWTQRSHWSFGNFLMTKPHTDWVHRFVVASDCWCLHFLIVSMCNDMICDCYEGVLLLLLMSLLLLLLLLLLNCNLYMTDG